MEVKWSLKLIFIAVENDDREVMLFREGLECVSSRKSFAQERISGSSRGGDLGEEKLQTPS